MSQVKYYLFIKRLDLVSNKQLQGINAIFFFSHVNFTNNNENIQFVTKNSCLNKQFGELVCFAES